MIAAYVIFCELGGKPDEFLSSEVEASEIQLKAARSEAEAATAREDIMVKEVMH